MYRAEIDGLRAIAVLAVVLYHFGVPGIPGGYVGVDIFFVISGFLIGGILWSEHAITGKISFSKFYTRRFRRLAPAFFAMAAATALFSWFILLPFEFRAFGKSLIAATFYLANVQFFREAGYFDTGAEDKVLLHTWSLSVEEQFYVFLPLLLLFLGRWPRVMVVALWLSAVLSLIACVAFTPTVPTATFYLFPFRAWELFAGVLLAITGQDRAWSWSIHPALSWSGLALVAISITMLQPGAAFPGYLAMAPVAGSVLIIANGRNTNLVNRFLSSGTAVGIGLISYSLYLWHWPVLTLSRYYREDYANSFEAALWMLLAFGLAYASWRFVEQPFRKPTVRPFWQVLGAVAVCSAIAALFGAYAYLSNGAANRFRHEARLHIAASADFLQDWSRCTTASTGPLADIEVCKIGPDTLPPEVLVWGDSHARAYMDGIAQAANETNKPGLLIWHAGCPPLFELRKQESAATPAEDAACETANKKIRLAIPQLKSIKRVLLIGRWSYYQSGQGVGLDQHNQITLTPEADIQNLDADQTNLLSDAIEQTVTELRRSQMDVYIMRQPPELPAYSSRMIARKLAHGARTPKIQSAFSAPMEQLLSRSQPSDQILKTLQSSNAATVINPWPELCTKTECSVMKNGAAVYFDNNHLTNTGARMLRKLFMPFLRGDAS